MQVRQHRNTGMAEEWKDGKGEKGGDQWERWKNGKGELMSCHSPSPGCFVRPPP